MVRLRGSRRRATSPCSASTARLGNQRFLPPCAAPLPRHRADNGEIIHVYLERCTDVKRIVVMDTSAHSQERPCPQAITLLGKVA